VGTATPDVAAACVSLLQSNAEQSRLRELRGELNAARAELTEAQQQLVAARGEEAKMRKVLEEEPQKDRTLGAPGGCCWWYCPALW
jgi:chromosome segregation ATPase